MHSLKSHTIESTLATYLIQNKLLSADAINLILKGIKKTKYKLITYLVNENILSSELLLESFSKSFQFPIVENGAIPDEWFTLINPELIQQYRFIPFKKDQNTISIALSDPTDSKIIEILNFSLSLKSKIWLIDEKKLNQLLLDANSKLNHKRLQIALLKELNQEENTKTLQENNITYDEPIVKFVDHIFEHAIQQGCSDIHIEPYEKNCRIRYRKDGLLYEAADIAINIATRLITRLKVMAKLDISERRLPQDGRLKINTIDMRINTCPTLFGEKMVLRLLDNKKSPFDLQDLGFDGEQYHLFVKHIHQPQGLILVTGPTGSGKTVTLYSALNALNTSSRNISTVEDPIEIELLGINQVSVNRKIKLDFATILRTFLRQDPDVIMIGEIRDRETAEIAIQAAQTGHLVLSTLHTNNAIETISRLITMGIPIYNLINSLTLIVSQRLIRKLCDYCKQLDPGAKTNYPNENSSTSYKAMGCSKCLNGYQNRVGIYELLPLTPTIISLISEKNNESGLLTKTIQKQGYKSLRQAGLEKVNQGTTSLTEINRVISI